MAFQSFTQKSVNVCQEIRVRNSGSPTSVLKFRGMLLETWVGLESQRASLRMLQSVPFMAPFPPWKVGSSHPS